VTRILDSLGEVADAYRGLLCDVWGVYHDGTRVFPAASRALRAFRKSGGRVVLLTNAPRPAEVVADAVAALGGAEADRDAIVTSGDAARGFRAAGRWGRRACHVGPARDLPLVRDLDLALVSLEEADFILCTGLDDDRSETAEDYAGMFSAARTRGLPMLCSNPDRNVDIGGLRVPCAGALAEAYEAMGGHVKWFGKPYRPVYEAALQVLDDAAGAKIPRSQVLAIGDGILTDVAGAAAMGIDCLFVSGGLAAGEIRHECRRPRADDLSRFLERHGQAPKAAMGWLA